MGFRNCVICGSDTGKIGNVKFCTDACKKEYHKSKGTMYNSRGAKKRANDKYTAKNKEKLRMIKLSYRMRLKYDVLSHYSVKETPVCSRCGCEDIDCLVIDHVNNDGAEHRKKLKINGRGSNFASGTSTYEALKANNFPDDVDLQVLCANCNTKKEIDLKRRRKESNPFYEQYITNDERLSWVTSF